MPTTITFRNIAIRQPISPALRAKAHLTDILQEKMLVDGVFEGGGALGTAYLGGLRALHDNGIWFKRVAGNSAGSITAAMIAVGFTAPEIQWLSSAFPNVPAPNTLLLNRITKPIPFADFLDLPSINSITRSSKRQTLLWNALKGTIFDEIGKTRVPVPTQREAVNECLQNILRTPILGDGIRAIPDTSAEELLRDALNGALAPLPNRQLHISDFMLDTEDLRIALADTLWDAIVRNSPLQLLMTNLLYEGSIFEGTAFLNKIKVLFGKKVHNNPDATVLFEDLKIPLVVIASNIDTGEMIVYSSKNHPKVEVAEAVRQSMSIPFVFEPRGRKRQIVDGGLCSNFPVWVYSSAGNNHWKTEDIDNNRLKIGFSLDETKLAPSNWNAKQPRFRLVNNPSPPYVDVLEVARPILIEKLVEIGMPRNLAELEITWALFGDETSSSNSKPGIELIQEIIGVTLRGVMNTEESTRKVMTLGLMQGLPYIDIPIPLLGFHALDFYINEDEEGLFAMWDRAWRKTIEILQDAANRGILPQPMTIRKTQTPFND